MIQKKNKDINRKCYALRNRIEILKKEEEIYKKQLKNIKKKEQQDRIIQNDKTKIKMQLEKLRNEQNKELKEKKERIQRFKVRIRNRLEEKKNENLSKKKRKYQSAMNDKYLMKSIIEEINTQQNNRNCYQHAKVKQQFNEFETNRMKRNMIKENKETIEQENNLKVLKFLERKMMNAYNELEAIEKKYLEKIKDTKNYNLRYIENSSDFKSKYIFSKSRLLSKRNLNASMDIEINNDDKRFNNSTMSPSTQSQKYLDIRDKFNNTTFTQSSSVSNFRKKKVKSHIKNESYTKRNKNNSYIIENKEMNQTFIFRDIKNKKIYHKINNNNNQTIKMRNWNNTGTINKSAKIIKIKKNIRK